MRRKLPSIDVLVGGVGEQVVEAAVGVDAGERRARDRWCCRSGTRRSPWPACRGSRPDPSSAGTRPARCRRSVGCRGSRSSSSSGRWSSSPTPSYRRVPRGGRLFAVHSQALGVDGVDADVAPIGGVDDRAELRFDASGTTNPRRKAPPTSVLGSSPSPSPGPSGRPPRRGRCGPASSPRRPLHVLGEPLHHALRVLARVGRAGRWRLPREQIRTSAGAATPLVPGVSVM